MQELCFSELMSILKRLEKGDINGKTLETMIIDLLDCFTERLSDSQRSELMSAFITYEEKRQERKTIHDERFTAKDRDLFMNSQQDYYS